ncbi:hypothetical protein BSKO_10462 [Bryopsis sp. KO-2023]|nr:hypothetical protein BSKO_10462 [Bryopsis sp. KO-2023]
MAEHTVSPTRFFFLAAVLLPLAAANVKFTVLHFNDFHARIEPDDETHTWCDERAMDSGACHGGIARMKTIIDKELALGNHVIVLNAGDNFIGTLWDYHFKGNATAQFMTQLDITVMTLGNHDFDYGPDLLADFLKGLPFPVVGTNVNANGHEIGKYIKKYHIIDIEGNLIGICGSTTKLTMEWSKPEPVTIEDPILKAKECIQELKLKGVEIIIMLTHDGNKNDARMAEIVPGIDLIVGGHSHTFLYTGEPPALSFAHGQPHRDKPDGPYPVWQVSRVEPNRTIPILQASWASRYMGRAVVEFDSQGELVSLTGAPILLGSKTSENPVEENPEFKRQIKELKEHWDEYQQ